MKAMILAAGVGSRLDPLTRNTPKPMVPIVNRPVLEHVIELLAKHGFDQIMMNLHYLGSQIERHFQDGSKWAVEVAYSKEEDLLGTAGAVKAVEEFFDDTFVVIGGDDLSDIDLTRAIEYHKSKKAVATIALSLVDDPSQYGIVMTNEKGRITRFSEKPKGELIFGNAANTGIYIFEPRVLDLIPRGKFYDFGRDLFPLLIDLKEPFYGLLTSSYWRDIGGLAEYREAHYDALTYKACLRILEHQTERQTWIGSNVQIDEAAQIEPPVLIGNGCSIERGAQVLGNTILGPGCVIEKGARVKESILWAGARVLAGTTIEACVVGHNCKVGSNAAVFNGVIVEPGPNGAGSSADENAAAS
jgi:NDP-sugar pyrophosphorylase family protein